MRRSNFRVIFCFLFFQCCSLATRAQLHGQARIDSLMKVFEYSKQDSNKVLLFYALAKEYDNNDSQKAMQYCRKALSLAKQIDFKKGQIKVYNEMGIVMMNNYIFIKAKEY